MSPRPRRTLAQLERELAQLKAKCKAERERSRVVRTELAGIKRALARVCRKALQEPRP